MEPKHGGLEDVFLSQLGDYKRFRVYFPGCKPLKHVPYYSYFRHLFAFFGTCSSVVRKSDGCACGGGDHDIGEIGKQWMPVKVCKQKDLKIQDSFSTV